MALKTLQCVVKMSEMEYWTAETPEQHIDMWRRLQKIKMIPWDEFHGFKPKYLVLDEDRNVVAGWKRAKGDFPVRCALFMILERDPKKNRLIWKTIANNTGIMPMINMNHVIRILEKKPEIINTAVKLERKVSIHIKDERVNKPISVTINASNAKILLHGLPDIRNTPIDM